MYHRNYDKPPAICDSSVCEYFEHIMNMVFSVYI